MPKPIIRAVFKRELKSWFSNPTGYVFIVFFVFLAALAMVGSERFFSLNLANLDTLTGLYFYLLLFFIPAVSMGIWSTERSNGTQELLFTLPARDFQILMGKYLAVAAIYTVSLAFTLALPAGLWFMGDPDWGLIASTYLGYWLVGLMLISVAMIGSQLTDNLAVAFIVGLVLCGVVLFSDVWIGWLPFGLGTAWKLYGPTGMYSDLGRGVVTPSAFFIFAGWTAAFLYLNLALLQRRKVTDVGEFATHRMVRFGALIIVFSAAAIWGLNHLPRADVTEEQVHSLSEDTSELLAQLSPERPVFVQAFVSDDVPEAIVRTRRTLLDLLDQYDKIAGDSLEVRIVPTEAYSDASEEAADNYEIAGQRVDPRQLDPVFMGVAVQCGTEEVTVPFFMPGMSVEYELTRSIRTVANTERRKVGILKTDVEFEGSMDFQTMRRRPNWPIVDELQLQYDVEGSVSPDDDYPADLAVLIVPMVSSLTQPQMDRLMEYIQDGKKVILLDDPSPQAAPGTSATDPKGGQQNPMMRQPPQEQKGNIDVFLGMLDIRYPYRELVFDTFNPHAAIDNSSQPELIFVDAEVELRDDVRPLAGLDRKSPITKDLSQVVTIFGGYIEESDTEDGLAFEPLLRTSAALSGTLPKSQAFQMNPLFGPQLNPYRVHKPDAKQHVLGARVTGESASGNDLDVIFLADIDMVSPVFFQLQKTGQLDSMGIRFDNVALILNCIDELAGDRSYIELRSRQPKHRSLERIAAEQREFNERLLEQKAEAEASAKKALEAANDRLKSRIASIESDQSLDRNSRAQEIAAAQKEEQRNLDRETARIEKEKSKAVARAEKQRREEIKSIHRKYQVITLAGAPLAPLLLGVLVWFLRGRRESVIVPEVRKRGAA